MVQNLHALVVDDESSIRFFLREVLATCDLHVTAASSGEEALEHLRDTRYDLVLLDLKLGGRVDGMRLLSAVRWRWPNTAVIILTAHGSLENAVEAIREGIDGYLLKPVEAAELRQVVREAIDRRRALASPEREQSEQILRHGTVEVDLQKHTVTRDGQALDLGPQEFKLLVCLMQNARRVVSPEELVRTVRDYDPDSRYEAREIVKWYVHQLRRKLEADPAHPRLVLNTRGVGYTLGE